MDVFIEIPARRLADGDTGEFTRLGPQQFRNADFNLLADLGIVQRRQQFRLVDVRETTTQRTLHYIIICHCGLLERLICTVLLSLNYSPTEFYRQ
jgi:hypothetical protein